MSDIVGQSVDVFVCFQGQIMANLKAMDSDWFGQTYLGKKSKVKMAIIYKYLFVCFYEEKKSHHIKLKF